MQINKIIFSSYQNGSVHKSHKESDNTFARSTLEKGEKQALQLNVSYWLIKPLLSTDSRPQGAGNLKVIKHRVFSLDLNIRIAGKRISFSHVSAIMED